MLPRWQDHGTFQTIEYIEWSLIYRDRSEPIGCTAATLAGMDAGMPSLWQELAARPERICWQYKRTSRQKRSD